MKAVIHARVSTEKQKQNNSLETQLQAGREYARQLNAEIVEEIASDFANEGDDREDFDRIYTLVTEGKVDAVFFFEIDRFTRGGVAEFLTFMGQLQGAGAQIFFSQRKQPAGTKPGEKAFDSMRAIFAQLDKDGIKERMQRGWKGKAERGQYVGHGKPNYGYRRVGYQRNVSLEVDEPTAAVVREIFHRFTGWNGEEREGVRAIVKTLTARGEPTPQEAYGTVHPVRKRGAGEWIAVTVYKILHNPVYKGTAVVYRFKSEGYKRSRSGKRYIQTSQRPEDEHITTTVPAIITEAEWELAQQILAEGRAQSKRGTKYWYLLARLMRCECGCVIRGKTNKRTQGRLFTFYTCHGHDPTAFAHDCRLRSFPAKDADALVWEWAQNILLHERFFQDEPSDEQAKDRTTQETAFLRTKLFELDEEDRTARRQARKGIISDDELEEARAEIAQQKKEFQERIDRLERQRASRERMLEYRAQREVTMGHYREALRRPGAVPPDAQRALLEILEVRITVTQLDANTHELRVFSLLPFDEDDDVLLLRRT